MPSRGLHTNAIAPTTTITATTASRIRHDGGSAGHRQAMGHRSGDACCVDAAGSLSVAHARRPPGALVRICEGARQQREAQPSRYLDRPQLIEFCMLVRSIRRPGGDTDSFAGTARLLEVDHVAGQAMEAFLQCLRQGRVGVHVAGQLGDREVPLLSQRELGQQARTRRGRSDGRRAARRTCRPRSA